MSYGTASLVYIISTIFGILLFFEVIGPSFYTKDWPHTEERPPSIFFFTLIGKIETVEEWMSFFIENINDQNENYLQTEDLKKKAIHDFTIESYQLSKKAIRKVKLNLIAHFFFYISFCSLLLMVYIGIVDHFCSWSSFTMTIPIIIFLIFLYIEYRLIKKAVKS